MVTLYISAIVYVRFILSSNDLYLSSDFVLFVTNHLVIFVIAQGHSTIIIANNYALNLWISAYSEDIQAWS